MIPYRVFLVEDNPADVFLIREALREHAVACDVTVSHDGEEARDHLNGITRQELCPSLILLDLNLPKISGITLLEFIRQHAVCAETPVAVLTSSGSAKDRERVQSLGVKRFIQKPTGYKEFLAVGAIIREILTGENA